VTLIDKLLAGTISDEQKSIIDTITAVAHLKDIDPILAVSIAILESGLNPRAVGDNFTSFGLYQLHKGGELGKLTEEQAFDPTTNAQTALQYVRSFHDPKLSPGQNAANAQRPAHPKIYAASINVLYPLVKQLFTKMGIS